MFRVFVKEMKRYSSLFEAAFLFSLSRPFFFRKFGLAAPHVVPTACKSYLEENGLGPSSHRKQIDEGDDGQETRE